MIMKETTEKVSSSNSILLTMTDLKQTFNLVLPIVDFTTEDNGETITLTLNFDFSMLQQKMGNTFNDKDIQMGCDYTDDPTPENAGSVISLGYPLIRLIFDKCRLVSFNPLVFTGEKKYFKQNTNREQRDSLITMPKIEPKSGQFMVDKDSIMWKRYIMSIPLWERPVYMVCATIGKKFKNTTLECLDMTTFYSRLIIMEHYKHRTKEALTKKFNELIKKVKGMG